MTASKVKKNPWLTSYIPHRLEMFESPAWKARSVPLARILERLEVEHMRYAGGRNGGLNVSYTQFHDCGVSRRTIAPALKLGSQLGLLEVISGQRNPPGNLRPPNSYRLTYVPATGARAPTDEWKKVNNGQAAQYLASYLRRTGTK